MWETLLLTAFLLFFFLFFFFIWSLKEMFWTRTKQTTPWKGPLFNLSSRCVGVNTSFSVSGWRVLQNRQVYMFTPSRAVSGKSPPRLLMAESDINVNMKNWEMSLSFLLTVRSPLESQAFAEFLHTQWEVRALTLQVFSAPKVHVFVNLEPNVPFSTETKSKKGKERHLCCVLDSPVIAAEGRWSLWLLPWGTDSVSRKVRSSWMLIDRNRWNYCYVWLTVHTLYF